MIQRDDSGECFVVREENQVLVFRSVSMKVNSCEPNESPQNTKERPMISCPIIFVL